MVQHPGTAVRPYTPYKSLPKYCTIVQKQIIYKWILSDFSFDDCSGSPRHTDAKTDVKNYQGPTTFRENVIRKYLKFPHTFF